VRADTTARPPSVTIALVLMVLLSLIWIALGGLIAAGIHPGMTLDRVPRAIVAALSIAAGCAALGIAAGLARRSRLGYFAALAFLGVTTVAVAFDQVGWADLVFVAINVAPLYLLLRDRLWYLRS